MKKIVTYNFEETRELGEQFPQKLKGGEVICLWGNLGSGKTTFTQGLLKCLGARGPYTSPTFVLLKEYKLQKSKSKRIKRVYHLDAYRVGTKDVLDLGWEEIVSDPKNVMIIEWPERIKKIIPKSASWIRFRWLGENEREIEFEK